MGAVVVVHTAAVAGVRSRGAATDRSRRRHAPATDRLGSALAGVRSCEDFSVCSGRVAAAWVERTAAQRRRTAAHPRGRTAAGPTSPAPLAHLRQREIDVTGEREKDWRREVDLTCGPHM